MMVVILKSLEKIIMECLFDGKVELTYKNMNCVFTFENDVLDGKYVIVINNEFKLQG